ncbi:hypothetical protein [Leptolyngbya sp. 7M]|uniref:hypothetical protein n=1 Tax=Leptolyngbya sp. 7M TaxID=2812896 RepID=UPI001B8D6181|nr:hypothetical protein [Leptolyngbya sp. 7M]QYO65926.1 hypothetical protein JVX88_03760 [Leptolyngbya sp. 7M]
MKRSVLGAVLSGNYFFDASRSKRLVAIVPVVFVLVHTVAAQATDRYDPTDAPPPMKIISDAERKQLDSTRDVKKRTSLALELMETRLKAAAEKNAADDFKSMFEDLGAFHALMDDTLAFLDRSSSNRKAILNNFKRFEIGLRRLAPQLELLRREVPPERERYIYYLGKDLREARAKAVEPMFSDTVVPGARRQQQDEP